MVCPYIAQSSQIKNSPDSLRIASTCNMLPTELSANRTRGTEERPIGCERSRALCLQRRH